MASMSSTDSTSGPAQGQPAHVPSTTSADMAASNANGSARVKSSTKVNGVAANSNSIAASDVMSQQSSQAVDDAASEDASLLAQPASSARATPTAAAAAAASATTTTTTTTTTTSGRGRGRGRWARAKGKVTKPAQPRAPTGRGRRQKVYDNLKAQAAHERAQELKQAYNSLAKLVKPALQELADRSVNELLEDPAVLEEVPEYAPAEKFLRDRHRDELAKCDIRRQMDLQMAEHVYRAECEQIMHSFNVQLGELCEERYGQLLRQLDILEQLYDNKLPVDLPAPPDDRYLFKEITQEEADSQGVFYQTEDGVEVPFPAETISQLMKKPQTQPLEATKRKADGQPDGQPASKIPAAAKEGDSAPQMPRHSASLLGAALDPVEESAPETPESASNPQTPTPAPEPAEDATKQPEKKPGNGGDKSGDKSGDKNGDKNGENNGDNSGDTTPDDGPELPLPRGASSPDEHGVRLISRRPTRLDSPNNRIMVPNTFEWDELDIGFRDSTNCVKKGATKQRRGKYLGRPDSNYMFIDRRVGIWDSTLAEGELDEELVKKHRLHPTLGIVLPDSVNKWEPPKPLASGWKPVVLVPPRGDPIHTSRSIRAAHIDQEADLAERRFEFARMLRGFCAREGIEDEHVAPDPALVEEKRARELVVRGLDPAQVVQHEPLQREPSPAAPEPAREDAPAFGQFAKDALAAAAAIEAEEGAARTAAAAANRTQPSRPYDAIRDVFTEKTPARDPTPQPTPTPQPVQASQDAPAIGTTSLSVLADLASHREPTPAEPRRHAKDAPSGAPAAGDQPDRQPSYPRPVEYPQPEPARVARPKDIPLAPEPVRANDFLRTALNPQSPINPAPAVVPVQEYPSVPVAPPRAPAPAAPTQPPQTTTGRTPFSNTGTTKGLPALRPVRNLLHESHPMSEPQGSAPLHHGNMAVSNSGAYYPPAASRPYHSGYSLQEPMHPIQPAVPQQPLANPLQPATMAGPPLASAPPRRMSPYSVSPPPYHQPVVSPALGPAPVAPAPGPTPILPQGAQQSAAHTAVPPARSHPGAPPASSSKYRKLEPAPTPPHRLSYSANGQELRTVQFDYREAIKDYTPVEAPPRHGPTQIRGWTHNNLRKARPASSKGDANINNHGSDEPA